MREIMPSIAPAYSATVLGLAHMEFAEAFADLLQRHTHGQIR